MKKVMFLGDVISLLLSLVTAWLIMVATPVTTFGAVNDYYVSLWVHEHHSDADQQIVGWFDGNDNLQWVKSETHFRIYDSSHPAYQSDEFQQAFPSLPV
ncbi:MAG: hypothetical protein ACKVT0_23175, partial [Planctomycetaceae bacterium]